MSAMSHKKTDTGDETAGVNRRAVITSAVLAASTLLVGTGGISTGTAHARTAGGVAVRLPAPTGPYRTGAVDLHLVDRRRRDPWDEAGSARELMVTVFYPARAAHGIPVAPQMTPGTAAAFTAFDPLVGHKELPDSGVDWAATATHSRRAVPALPGRRPVLLYTPGGADPRTVGTSLAEDLASHGYVVVTVDHPGEPGGVEFPDGSIREYALPGTPDVPQVFRAMIAARLADLRFVLDELTALADAGRNPDAGGRRLPAGLGQALDLRRVGVYGHSAGGTAASEALYEDRRIGAAVNLEGYLDWPAERPGEAGELLPVTRHGVDRPLLLFGTDGFRNARFDRSWSAMLGHPQGRTAVRRLVGANHWVFTDYASLVPQLQSAGLMTGEERRAMVGAIRPEQSVPVVRGQLRAFFARHVPMGCE
ncbi:alpha/beta hydrolase family protein [Streptomyces sp. NPDC021093]|uniref:alpha/beta hydrolase family protein n=1 Tax=Streptomyces sp. NPDC021093 TaxID=3365112 RepID=UPI0037A59DD5